MCWGRRPARVCSMDTDEQKKRGCCDSFLRFISLTLLFSSTVFFMLLGANDWTHFVGLPGEWAALWRHCCTRVIRCCDDRERCSGHDTGRTSLPERRPHDRVCHYYGVWHRHCAPIAVWLPRPLQAEEMLHPRILHLAAAPFLRRLHLLHRRPLSMGEIPLPVLTTHSYSSRPAAHSSLDA